MISALRNIALSSQGLSNRNKFGAGLNGTLQSIENLGYVQIDTLSVVERAHHHVLWNRVANYEQDHLNTLTAEKKIFEYWFHAAAYLPIKHYRFSLLQKEQIRKGENRYFNFQDQKLMNAILNRIKVDGALKLRHIEKQAQNNKSSWWSSGPVKRAFEQLFMQGDIMICGRDGMEKIYNLSERCLADDIDQSMPTIEEYACYLFDTTVKAHGVFSWKQLLHLKSGKKLRESMIEIVQEKISSNQIIKIEHGLNGELLVDSELLNQSQMIEQQVKILSPFDNLVIHRDRLQSLFNFDYRIECYLPSAKRQYGYFCLPILFGNKIVARIDCKAHRAEKKMEIISFHKELNANVDADRFHHLLSDEIINFSQFNNCRKIEDKSKYFNQLAEF